MATAPVVANAVPIQAAAAVPVVPSAAPAATIQAASIYYPNDNGKRKCDESSGTGFQAAFIMINHNRRGRWTVPKSLSMTSIMGGNGLDFRFAVFIHKVTTITASSMFGGCKVIVPRGVKVVSKGWGFLGSFSGPLEDTGAFLGTDYPTIVLQGFAMFGGTSVVVDQLCPPVTVVYE